MDESVFRKKSLERISSPEELGETLRVTNPAVWILLIAVIILLAGMLIWSSVASLDSFASGTGVVENGTMHIHFDDEKIARSVESGMTVTVGETESRITSVGTEADGSVFAAASTTLADGSYTVRVIYSKTQVISLLFN